jgi:alanine racemase
MADLPFPHNPSVPLALLIDLEALSHNYRTLCASLQKGTICAAVLKANAYGMGVKEVAPRLYQEGCRHFFMAHLSEALEIKSYVGDDSFIYVLAGLRQGDEAAYDHYNIIPVLGDISQVQNWNIWGQRKNKSVKAVLHLDTGMTRTGFSPEAIKNLTLLDLSNVELVCVMSHLACAYQPAHPMNENQRQTFDELRKRFHTIPASFVSSGGLCLAPSYQYDIVRVGLALTGCAFAGNLSLKPVLKAYTQVIQINYILPGTSVGYDADFIAQRPSRIATLGVGYADGYLRSLGNRGEVYFKGHFLPVVGRISMDHITVDVTGIDIHPGDWVELFGENVPAHILAEKAGTVSWELFTRLGQRFERFYLGSQQKQS